MKKNSPKALIMMALAMGIFGTTGILRRNIEMSSVLLACWRGICGTAFLSIFCVLRRQHIFIGINKKQVLGFALSGAFIGINWILLFESYRFTTVAVATLCYYMAPTIVILCSPLLFKEKITLKKGICAGLAIVGMVLVSGVASGVSVSEGDTKGILFGLGAALFYATVVIMNKKLPGVNTYAKTIIQLSAAAIVMIPYVIIKEDLSAINFSGNQWIWLLVIGLVNTGLAYTLYFASMDGLRTQSVAIMSYIDPVLALILSSLILQEVMNVPEMIGAVLIIGSALFSELGINKE